MTDPVDFCLSTPQLELRPVTAGDFPSLVSLWQDTEFTSFITGQALSEEDVWMRLLRDIGHWQVLGYGNFAIRERASGKYVGSVGLFDYRRTLDPAFDCPEAGWGIAPAFQGKGLAYEALSAMLRWVDGSLAIERTACMISPDNIASIKLAARTGFRAYTEARYKNSEVTLFKRSSIDANTV